MSATPKLNRETENVSRKPPLGEKRPRPRLVWENPALTADRHKEKSEARPGSSYGRVLYNYHRDYDPVTGRYIEPDPIGLAGGLNTYLYANANPLRYTDPTGETVCADGDVMCEIAIRQAGLPPDPPPRGDLKLGCFMACLAIKPAIGQAGTVAAKEVATTAAQSSNVVLRATGVVVAKGAQALSTPVGITISVGGAIDLCLQHCSEKPDSCRVAPSGE